MRTLFTGCAIRCSLVAVAPVLLAAQTSNTPLEFNEHRGTWNPDQTITQGMMVKRVRAGALIDDQTPPGPASQETGRFEVASVRQNKSHDTWQRQLLRQRGGAFRATGMPLRDLIRVAYGLGQFEPVDGPAPALIATYDIEAVLAGRPDSSGPGVFERALEELLRERFALAVHRETRQVEGYELTSESKDRDSGDHIRRSALNCAELRLKRMTTPRTADGRDLCALYGGPAASDGPSRGLRVRGGGHTMSQFATTLQLQLRVPVIDRTGLSGPYELDVTYKLPPVGVVGPGDPSDFAEIDDALREQIGLRLKRVKVPVEALIVDRVGELVSN